MIMDPKSKQEGPAFSDLVRVQRNLFTKLQSCPIEKESIKTHKKPILSVNTPKIIIEVPDS